MRWLLFLLLAFTALTASISGLLLVSFPDGSVMQMSTVLLSDTAFRSFLVPGIILAVVVGGTNLVAAVFNLLVHPLRYNWSLASAVVLGGWILVQLLLIDAFHWLQLLYLFVAVMILLLTWQLKGKWAV
ncbi:hypothetical protein ESA94_06445 [Lacibacter luteus]|uniref:Uncharacterized protein n=1 Tax=Lacibacter luteus TaxID=2508719 RepID=A0A4Q1CNG6_9BACT|nr:hypothetical protein [Lacibacter luteus]RXK62633.1 hypothetical protein ESA94_06445 [Lacibacter luteus]